MLHLLQVGLDDALRVAELLPTGQRVTQLFAREGIPGCLACNIACQRVSLTSLLEAGLSAATGTVVLYCRLPERALFKELQALTDIHRVLRDQALINIDLSADLGAADFPVLATVEPSSRGAAHAGELSAVECWALKRGIPIGVARVTHERRTEQIIRESALGWSCPTCGGTAQAESSDARFLKGQSLQSVLDTPLQQLSYVDSPIKTILAILDLSSLCLKRTLSSLSLRERLALGLVRVVDAGVRGISLYVDNLEQLYPQDGARRLAELAHQISGLGITVLYEGEDPSGTATKPRVRAVSAVRSRNRWISLAMSSSEISFCWELERETEILEIPHNSDVQLWATEMTLKGASSRGRLAIPDGFVLTVVPSGLLRPQRWETLSSASGLDSALGRVFVGSRLARQRGLTLVDFETSRARSRCEECGGALPNGADLGCSVCHGQGLSLRAAECLYGSVSLAELRGMPLSTMRDRLWREGEVARLCDFLMKLGCDDLPPRTPLASLDPPRVDMIRWAGSVHRASARTTRQIIVGVYSPLLASASRSHHVRAVCDAYRDDNSTLCFFE